MGDGERGKGNSKSDKKMTDKTIKPLVRGAYDLQKLRIQTGLRLVATFKAKLGQAPGEKEDELDVEGKRLLKDLRAEYSRITDGITTSRISRLEFETDGLIDSVSEVALLDQYSQLDKAEKDSFKFIEQALKAVPVYSKFLREVKGIGPAMAGVIVSEIDIYKARHPSSLWKYAGLDVASDGKGRSRKERSGDRILER